MTTYQDPPLQSRRAVRQGERPEAQQPSSPFAPPQVPRTAAGAGEPLSYVTQNRPPLPGYEAAPAQGRRASGAAADDDIEQPSPPQGFRPRDFSPEARTAPPAWAPEDDRTSGIVEYHTQARAQVTPPPATPVPETAPATSLAASLASEPSEQTLTRRELRALREAHGITAAPPTDVTPVVPEQSGTAPAPAPQAPAAAPSTQLDSAMAEFDALTGRGESAGDPALSRRAGRRAAAPSDTAPEDGLAGAESEPDTEAAVPPLVEPAPRAEPTALVEPAPFAAPAPVTPAPVAPEQHAVVLPPEPKPMTPATFAPPAGPAFTPDPVAPTTGERPVGHWTNQSDLDDREQVVGSPISRRVGSGAITTSALVLPSIPGHDMSTGEVMLTDSVSLPNSLASTGAHHAIDESDLDHLLDPGDHQAINTDSVPIRAIRAVSSHTNSSNPLIAAAKPHRGSRALTALIVSASGMVVVVVTLLVVALATEII